jgi:hypothetical protein
VGATPFPSQNRPRCSTSGRVGRAVGFRRGGEEAEGEGESRGVVEQSAELGLVGALLSFPPVLASSLMSAASSPARFIGEVGWFGTVGQRKQ